VTERAVAAKLYFLGSLFPSIKWGGPSYFSPVFLCFLWLIISSHQLQFAIGRRQTIKSRHELSMNPNSNPFGYVPHLAAGQLALKCNKRIPEMEKLFANKRKLFNMLACLGGMGLGRGWPRVKRVGLDQTKASSGARN